MLRRILGGFFEDSGALMVLIALVGVVTLIYMGDWEVFKGVLITFQPVIYGMALVGSLTAPILVFRQLWVAVICNFAVSAGLMYLAQVVIESWR